MAGVVGVTQKQILDEFYMLDLFEVAKNTRKQQALERLELINIVNSSKLEKNDYKELVRRYLDQAGIRRQVENKFDKGKMDELRALTNSMRG